MGLAKAYHRPNYRLIGPSSLCLHEWPMALV
nr:MAG TPA: hypothetical protein [Caudoviricetes sp.]